MTSLVITNMYLQVYKGSDQNQPRHYFPHYKLIGCLVAMETTILIQSVPKPYAVIRAVMSLLVTSNFNDDMIKNEQLGGIIFPIISVWGKFINAQGQLTLVV